MMKLHWSPRSPFVRKVMVAAHELGLADRIQTTRTLVGAAIVAPALLPDNPLNKIPTLVLDDGTVLYDSYVIIEYLDSLAGGRLIPREGRARFTELRRHALGNGFLDMLILYRMERERTPTSQPLLDAFATKFGSTLAAIDAEIEAIDADPPGIAQITLAIAGDYMDFRFADLGWRDRAPRYAAWQARFRERPSMVATPVVDG